MLKGILILFVVLSLLTFATVIKGSPDPSITIQPSNADSFIEEYNPDNNKNDKTYLSVKSLDGGVKHENFRSLVQFDLSSIPLGATITSATLHLYYYNSGSDPVDRVYWVYRVTSPWVESEVTWNNNDNLNTWTTLGGDYVTTNGASSTVPSSYSWMVWDVTDIMSDWMGGESNYGFIVMDDSENSVDSYYTRFRAREYTGDTELLPKLEVMYTIPETTTSTTTSVLTTTSTTTTVVTTTSTTTVPTTTSTTSTSTIPMTTTSTISTTTTTSMPTTSTTTTTPTTSTSTSTTTSTTTTIPEIPGTFVRFMSTKGEIGEINKIDDIDISNFNPEHNCFSGYLSREDSRYCGLVSLYSKGDLTVEKTLHYWDHDLTIEEEQEVSITLVASKFDDCTHFIASRISCEGEGVLIIHNEATREYYRETLDEFRFDIENGKVSIEGGKTLDDLFSVTELPVEIVRFVE